MKLVEDLIKSLQDILDKKQPYRDLSDLGNLVGLSVGNYLKGNISKEEIEDFVAGFEHGVSLTNGTHFK